MLKSQRLDEISQYQENQLYTSSIIQGKISQRGDFQIIQNFVDEHFSGRSYCFSVFSQSTIKTFFSKQNKPETQTNFKGKMAKKEDNEHFMESFD